MIWALVAGTVFFGLLGLLILSLAIRWAFDAPDFEDWVLVTFMTVGGLLVLFFPVVPWIMFAGDLR